MAHDGAVAPLRMRGDANQSSSESAFLARVIDASAAGPPGFSVIRSWLSVTKGRIRHS